MARLSAFRRLLATTWPSAVVAVAAWISIVVAIDPAGSYPNMPEGPGLTVDEIFNVEQGVLLVEQARSLGWLNLVPSTSVEAFKPENGYLPDHPPLGRYWLGVHHHLTWWLAPPFDPEGPCVTACARTGSATAFALTVWLIGAFVALRLPGRESPDFRSGGRESSDFRSGGRESPGSARGASSYSPTSTSPTEPGDSRSPLREDPWRRWDGFFASLALVLMPRVYGHAHLASLETITNLTCTAAVLAVAAWWNDAAPPSRRVALLTGVVMGLALLTKIQAVLIPLPVILWALWRWRAKAIVPLLIWGVTANVVFFALWPYLWLDPVGHFLEYLGRTTNRATIHCFYFGVRYDDKAVPWHYPFVMFAVTVPVGLHLLGVWGLWRGKGSGDRSQESGGKEPNVDRSRDWLLLACTVFPLIVFALPGVAVYDGERLFLTVFPLWAIFVGRGMHDVWHLGSRTAFPWISRSLLIGILVWSLAIPTQLRPVQLCYYNELVGGQSGADLRGLEIDYWGVGITRKLLWNALLDREHNLMIAVGPTLHQFQADEYRRQSPILRMQPIKMVPAESVGAARMKAIVFLRRADLPPKRASEKSWAMGTGEWWSRNFTNAQFITIDGDYVDPLDPRRRGRGDKTKNF